VLDRMKKFAAMFTIICLALSGCATVPGVLSTASPSSSQAWVSFDRQKFSDIGAEGFADISARRPVSSRDLVRVASVSKLVVALGVMRLVQEGKVNLDDDVSAALGWNLRNAAYPDQPITLRHLLSHRSSLRDDGESYAIKYGGSVQTAMRSKAAFDPDHLPGTYFQYANINYVVIASVMERASGQRFDKLMQELVIQPLALEACFGWSSCRPETAARGVTLYNIDGSERKDGADSRKADCPGSSMTGHQCLLEGYVLGTNGALFGPQGGLRISMADLAKIGQMLLNDGRHRGRLFLRPASVQALMTPVWKYDGTNGDTADGIFCSYGLGVQFLPSQHAGCRDELLDDRRQMIGHPGEAYGLLSGLWIDPVKKIGIAFYSAGADNKANSAGSAFFPVELALAKKLDVQAK
jgi:CubicO group peptidase (beta-lactamase class C family)